MLVRCAVLVTMMGLVACSGATNSGFFEGDNTGTDPTDAGPKSLGSKIKKDGGADGGEEAGTADGGAAKETPKTPTACAVANIPHGNGACDTCSMGACCTQWKTCDKNPDCIDLLQCAVKCAGDQDCVQTCVFLHPEGKADVVAVNECQNKNCAAECK